MTAAEHLARHDISIRVSAVSHAFPTETGDLEVLNKISLDVQRSEFMAIVGPSGCGKTTLLHVMGGLVNPSSGAVVVHGRHGDASIDVAFVFQEDSLFPWKTALGNVAFALRARGWDSKVAERRAEEVLQLVGLSKYRNLYPAQLSGGMKKRVALARALAVDPEVLLMDEAFAGADPELREGLQELLQQIHLRLRCTIVFVSHDLDEVVYLADRVVVLSERPATLRQLVSVPLPRPRGADLRSDVRLLQLKGTLWRATHPGKSKMDGEV